MVSVTHPQAKTAKHTIRCEACIEIGQEKQWFDVLIHNDCTACRPKIKEAIAAHLNSTEFVLADWFPTCDAF